MGGEGEMGVLWVLVEYERMVRMVMIMVGMILVMM